MYRSNRARPKGEEEVLGYEYDEQLVATRRVRLPVLAPGARRPPDSALLADVVILPRDHNKDSKQRLAHLQSVGAQDVPMPPGAAPSFMSLNRHVVVPQWDAKKGAPSVREQLEQLLSKRKLVLYVDRSNDEPVRVAIMPPLLQGELDEMFRRAGYKPKSASPKRTVIGSMGLLTETSKMGCYSFNLPAGPRYTGGTCPAAGLGFMYGTVGQIVKSQAGKRDKSVMIDPERFICNGCYAMKGAYGNPSTLAGMQVRKVIADGLLGGRAANLFFVSADEFEERQREHKRRTRKKADTAQALFTSGLKRASLSFAQLMILAISEARARVAARRAVLEVFDYTVAEYERTEERLEWLAARKRIKDLAKATTKKNEAKNKAEIAALVAQHGLTLDDDRETGVLAKSPLRKTIFADWQLPDPRYFRIHDAGDMFSDQYFRQWLEVCRHFSTGEDRVLFWAPTRMWAFAGGLRDESLSAIPDNLAMRPSTLHFRDTAPSQSYLHKELGLPKYRPRRGGGLAAPSGSAPEKPTAKDFKCPAYEHWSTGVGGAIRLDKKRQKGVGGTCITAKGPSASFRGRGERGTENGCRACWQNHDLVVFYEEH